MQNADDARNANEQIHIYRTEFCPWVISASGQEAYLGANPVRNITLCVVMLMVKEMNFQCCRQEETTNTEYLLS